MRRKFIDFPIPCLVPFRLHIYTAVFFSSLLTLFSNIIYANYINKSHTICTSWINRSLLLYEMNNEKVKFLLNWNHFSEHLSSCMTKLMTDTSYSDIIIATADKHMIYSHRFVLANSSKYFQRLLKNMKRQRGIQLVVALPEIKYDIFKILMNYMYRGETQVPHELLPSVIKAGQFLEINGLVNLNENDTSAVSDSSVKFSSTEELSPRCSIIQSSNSSSNHDNENSKERVSFTLRDKIHSTENTNNCSKNGLHQEKTTKKQKIDDLPVANSPTMGENGKENRSKLIKTYQGKNLLKEKKDFIQLPLKRKSTSTGEPVTVKSSSPSPSLSNKSSPPKKLQKTLSVSQEILNVKVKVEKEGSSSPEHESGNEGEKLNENITIKVEAPEIEEIPYNELKCEFCHEVYTNPSEWVKHMTDEHGDRGYQAYQNFNKNVGSNAVITCIVCSYTCFSAAEWAQHLRAWHTEKELANANMGESNKTKSKNKKSLSAGNKGIGKKG